MVDEQLKNNSSQQQLITDLGNYLTTAIDSLFALNSNIIEGGEETVNQIKNMATTIQVMGTESKENDIQVLVGLINNIREEAYKDKIIINKEGKAISFTGTLTLDEEGNPTNLC